MGTPSTERERSGSFLKMAGVLFAGIFLIVMLFVWVVNGPLLYDIDTLSVDAELIAPVPDPKHPDHRQLSIRYHLCRTTTETIALGPETLDAKAPTRLIEIRECLAKLRPGQNLKIELETRRQRLNDQKSWRIKGIGPCSFPHLPSRVEAVSHAPCPWM
jgi:hypothetical protein